MVLGPTRPVVRLPKDLPARRRARIKRGHEGSGMKILIVDDHAVVREGVAAVLRQAFEAIAVLFAADITAAIASADTNPDLDMVLLDLVMPGVSGPGVSGLTGLIAFASQHPAIPVIVLSSSEAEADVRGALAHGALGYVAKSARPATLVAAVRLVLSGEIYVPAFMAEHAPDSTPSAYVQSLTDRQRDVLQLVADRASNKEIAYRLTISEKTVKAHMTAIFRRLKVTSRAEAAQAATIALR